MPHNDVTRVSKNTLMLLSGTACRLVFSFAFIVYVASLMGLKGFGTYSLGIHYFELFLSLTATAIGIFITREAGRRPGRLSQLLSHGFVLVAALSVVAAGIMIVLGHVFDYAEETRQVLLIASLALLPASVAAVLEAAFVSLEQAQVVTSGTALESLLRIGLSFAALVAGFGLTSLFWILVLSRLLLAVFYGVCLARRVPLRFQFRMRRFRIFAWRWRVFAVENWLATVSTSLDVVILSALHGEAAVGLYTAAGKVVRLGAVAAKCYTTAVFPLLSRWYVQSREAFDQLNRDTLRILLAVMLPAVAVLAVLADRIMGLLFDEQYAAAVPVLQVLAGVMLFESLNPFLSHTLFAKGQQHRSMRVAAVALLVNLMATLWFASLWGAVGAAWGTLLGGAVACACYCLYSFERRDIAQLLLVATKVSLAATAFALVLLVLPVAHVAVAILAASAVYALLVVAFRVITTTDLRIFKKQTAA